MILGGFSDRPGGGGKALPHVVELSITRAVASGREFIVGIHEEGTALSWCRRVGLRADTEAFLIGAVRDLHEWSLRRSGLTVKQAQRLASRLGETLYRTFVGRPGDAVLRLVEPTAVMLLVDETLLSLPWELMPGPERSWRDVVPFGRIVATGIVPVRGRDPKDEDPLVRLLVVANPTGDLDAAETESDAIEGLAGTHGDVKVEGTRLPTPRAAPSGVRAAGQGQDFDGIHGAGHRAVSAGTPR